MFYVNIKWLTDWQDELKNYCTVISQLGSTVTEAATLHAMRLGDLVSLAGTHPGTSY